MLTTLLVLTFLAADPDPEPTPSPLARMQGAWKARTRRAKALMKEADVTYYAQDEG